jgi:hypothetical protein
MASTEACWTRTRAAGETRAGTIQFNKLAVVKKFEIGILKFIGLNSKLVFLKINIYVGGMHEFKPFFLPNFERFFGSYQYLI